MTDNNGDDGEFVDRLVPDPARPNVRRVRGFLLGRSNREGYLRLYLDPDLRVFLEFPREKVVHSQQTRDNTTAVWLEADTRVDFTRTATMPVDFLKGDIVQGLLSGTAPSGLRTMARMAAGDGSGCAHTGCSAGCTPGY